METIAGRYEILEILGAGGMGKVYKARLLPTGALVAIKQLRAESKQSDAIQRFTRESQALRDLNHPNIVRIHEAFQEDNEHYLVMEYLPRGSLADKLEEGQLAISEIIELSIDLADALTRAHKLGIIHCDLKPDNVLIAEDGSLRLSDFGVAYFAKQAPLTKAEGISGTIDYIAPEIFSGAISDTRADIWAFGVMLFEMLAGRRPYLGKTVSQTIYAIMGDSLPMLEELRPDAPLALLDLVYRMLERDPNARIASVRLVGAELEAIAEGRASYAITRFETETQAIPRFPNNLPAQTSPFIGREAELFEIVRLLNDPAIRLVTILAPGGMGKTRLSLEVAESQIGDYRDGVFFVELAPYSAVQEAISAIAQAISFQIPADANKQDALLNYLSDKQMLLVLDNFEHLLEAAPIVGEILKASAQSKILVTSRLRLQQAGESLFNLDGMDFPDWETPQDAMQYAAVQLFMQSARRVRPDFELSPETLPYLARISRLVAGMPLAIILAAAWLALLSLEEIAEEIQKSLDFLEAESGEIPERQRSIRAVFEYSWLSMTAEEQDIFQQLSYFKAGFSREAAQAITGASLRHLLALVNKSLILRDVETGRYKIHELLRQYAAEKLAENPNLSIKLKDAHARYYLDYFARRTAMIKGKEQLRAREELSLERENYKQAALWATEQGFQAELVAAFESFMLFCNTWYGSGEAQSLWRIMEEKLRGSMTAIYARLCLGLGLFKPEIEEYAKANNDYFVLGFYYDNMGIKAAREGKFAEALAYSNRTLEVAHQINDSFYLSFTLRNLSMWSLYSGDFEKFMEHSFRARDLALAQGDYASAYWPLGNMAGSALTILGDYQLALKLTLQGLEEIQKYQLTAYVWRYCNLGIIYLVLGEIEKAKAIPDEAYQLAAREKNPQDYAMILLLTAYLKLLEGEVQAAERMSEESLKLFQNPHISHLSSVIFAFAALQAGDAAKTAELLRKNLGSMNLPALPSLGFHQINLPIIAELKRREGKPEEAALILAVAMQNPQSPIGFLKAWPFVASLENALKTQLSDAYEAIWERGKTESYLKILRDFVGA